MALGMEKIGERIGRFICRNKIATAAVALVFVCLLGGVIARTWHARRLAKANAERQLAVRSVVHPSLLDYRDASNYLLETTRTPERVKERFTTDYRVDRVSAIEDRGDMALEDYRVTNAVYQGAVADYRTDSIQPTTYAVTYPLRAGASVVIGNIDAANQNNPEYLIQTKKFQAALDIFRERLAISEQLVATDPGNVPAQTDLAYSSSRIGDVLAETGNLSEALPYYQRAVDIYTSNASTGQEDAAVSLKLSQVLGKLAQTHAKLGYLEKARAEASKAADLLQAIPNDANNLEQRNLRALANIEVADAYVLLARDARSPQRSLKEYWRTARDLYQRSLDILKDLRDRGFLGPDQVALIDTVSQKIAEADLFLTK